MATFDQLSAEQRAIVELVLGKGKTYAELADMLGMPEARVRGLARDALVELAPVSVRGVEEDWRGQLADYVLGQQGGPEATATRGHLRRSEGARAWTRSLLDSLEQLYENGSMPAIPDGERGRAREGRRSPGAGTTSSAGPSAAAAGETTLRDPAGRRRLAALAGGALAILLVVVLLWPVGLLTGGDDDDAEPAAAGDSAAQNASGEGDAAPQAGGAPAGIAIVARQNGERTLLVQAANLAPSGEREAYEVWLYNSRGEVKSLGGQVTDAQGQYQAAGPLPEDFADYRFIDVSREPLDQNSEHSGDSVLRGRVPPLREARQRGNRAVVLGQTVLEPPAG